MITMTDYNGQVKNIIIEELDNEAGGLKKLA